MEKHARDSSALLLLFCLTALGLYAYVLTPRAGRGAYTRRFVYGVVDTIYKYDKGFPVVGIRGGRITLQVPTGCSQYLRAGDLVNKASNTKQLRTVRDNGQYRESITWGYSDSAGINGFISSAHLPR